MAASMKFTGTDIAIGVGVLLVAFVVVFFIAGALNLAVPQWLLGAIGGAVGVAIWFAIIRRRKV